jgi:hypothetical protein
MPTCRLVTPREDYSRTEGNEPACEVGERQRPHETVGQAVARLLADDGSIVGVSYAPAFRGEAS